MAEMSESLKKRKSELDDIIKLCLDGNRKFFSDREKNRVRFEGFDTKPKTKKQKWQSNYVSPFPSVSMEQKSAFLTEAVTNLSPNFLEVQSMNNVDGADVALGLTRYFEECMEYAKPVEKIYLFTKDALIYGTGVMRVFWDYKERKRIYKGDKKLVVANGGLEYQREDLEEMVVDVDQPNFENLKLNNFYIDPEASSLDDARFVVTRQLINYKQVKSLKEARGLKNLAIAKEEELPDRNFGKLADSALGKLGRNNRRAEYDVDEIRTKNLDTKSKDNPICELMTIYRPGTVQLVLNGIPITDEQTVYDGIRYPFIILRNQPLNGEFFGRSDMDLIEPNVNFHEEMTNLIIDNYLEHLRPTTLIDQALGTDAIERIKKREPGDMVVVPDLDAILELRGQPFDKSSIEYANGFLQESKTAMAINPLMEGQNPGSGIRSEGSLEIFQQIGSTRMSLLVNMLANEMSKMGRMMISMLREYGDEEIYVTINGRLGDTWQQVIIPSQLPHKANVKVKLSIIADSRRQARLAQMRQMIMDTAQLDDTGTYRKERAMVEWYAASGDLWESPVDLWETDPQVIMARNELAASRAGKAQAGNPGAMGSPALQQALQPPAPQPQGSPNGPEMNQQPQRPGEGNPSGNNQFSGQPV